MRNKLDINIRRYVIVLLLFFLSIGLGYKFLFNNNNDINKTHKIVHTSEYKDIILIELITDFNDSKSVAFSNHIKKVCDYSKLPLQELAIEKWNSPTFNTALTTRIIVVQNTLKLNDDSIIALLNFVSQGGVLFVPTFMNDERMDYFYGLIKNGPRDRVNQPLGYFFNTDFLPNSKGTNYGDYINHGGLFKASFKDEVSILATAKNDNEYPTIIQNHIGLGNVILFNTTNSIRKRERGLLFSALLIGLEGIPYPIANVSTIFLNDFPSPLFDTKELPIKEEMNLLGRDFVKDIWWPNMLTLSDTFNIRYTALATFDYRNLTKPPFHFDQWDEHTLIENDKRLFVSDLMAKDILKHGHELGLHGYNHVSLSIKDWEIADYMKLSLNSTKHKWEKSGLGNLPVTYAPPSNTIDSIGMTQLGVAFPTIKYMSSLYLGNFEDGSDREFDVEKWNANFFNYPRISGGYKLSEEDKFQHQSLFLYSGIWTHYVNPNDIYQLPNSDNSSIVRNKDGLEWHNSKEGKPGLLNEFTDYLHKIEEIYPLSRYVSAEEGSIITSDWRASEYSFTKNDEEYVVQSLDKNNNGAYYWFLYSSNKNSVRVEAALARKTEKYEKTPILNGNLYSIKTLHPLLSIHNEKLNTILTSTIASRVTEDYYVYNANNYEYEVTNLVDQYVNTKPSNTASLEERIKYYVATEKLDKAAHLLKQRIDSEKSIDTSLFNAYYKYMTWQGKSKDAWINLNSHISEYPLADNIKYSRILGSKNGYPNETIKKEFLKLQFTVFNNKEILKEYYEAFNTPANKEEIAKVLNRLLKTDPSLKNELNYLKHLIAYKPKQALIELNKYIPNESSSLWSISKEISWLYANNKRYKKAYNWSKHTQHISIVNKLYWLSEIKDFETLRKEYTDHIANNPNDLNSNSELSKFLLMNKQQIESWGLVSTLPEYIQKDTLKHALKKQEIYINRVTQEDLINRFAELKEIIFQKDVQKEIEKEIHLSKNNVIAAETNIIGDHHSNTSFEKKITYSIKTDNFNTHSIAVTNNDLYDLEKTSFSDEDNVNKNVFGLEYKYSSKPLDKINYWVSGRVEKDKQDNLYYQAGIGASLLKEKSFTSLSANTNPVKTGPGYEKKIYQSKLSIYQENAIKNIFKTIVYAEGNHFSNDDLEGSITTKLVLDNNKEKMFKVLPQLEASYTKSNSNEVKEYPYYLVKKRFFMGGGIGLKYGTEKSNFKVSVEGATFVDNDLGDFNRLTGQASLKIGNFTKISVSAQLSTQSQAYSNYLKIGLKHAF